MRSKLLKENKSSLTWKWTPGDIANSDKIRSCIGVKNGIRISVEVWKWVCVCVCIRVDLCYCGWVMEGWCWTTVDLWDLVRFVLLGYLWIEWCCGDSITMSSKMSWLFSWDPWRFHVFFNVNFLQYLILYHFFLSFYLYMPILC
jgi:hypothetical protein